MKHIAKANGHKFIGDTGVSGTLSTTIAMSAPVGTVQLMAGSALSYGGGRLGKLLAGGPGAMLSSALRGMNLGSITSLVSSGLSAGVLGSLMGGGLNLGAITSLAGANLNLGSLSSVIGNVAGAAQLGNIISGGLSVSSLTSLAGANLNLGSLSSVIGNVAGASQLGNLLGSGLSVSNITSMVSAGINLGDLAPGALSSGVLGALQSAGISPGQLTDLVNGGLNGEMLGKLITESSGVQGLINSIPNVDDLSGMLRSGMDSTILGKLVGESKDGVLGLLSVDLGDADVGKLLRSGLNSSTLSSLTSIDARTLVDGPTTPTIVDDGGASVMWEIVNSSQFGPSFLESMLEGSSESAEDDVTVGGSPVLTAANIPIANLSFELIGDVQGHGNVSLVPGKQNRLVIDTTGGGGTGGPTVSSFNGRTGDVILSNTDVFTAIGFVPLDANATILFANNAAFLNGQPGSYYLDALNMTGTIPAARLSGTYDISINGNANSANFTLVANTSNYAGRLNTARIITLSGDVTGNVAFDGSSNVTIITTVANTGVSSWNDLADKPLTFPPEPHTQAISTIDGLQDILDAVITLDDLPNARPVNQVWTGNGVLNSFELAPGNTASGTLVTVDGLVQRPNIDYTITAGVISFTEVPENGASITAGQFGAFINNFGGEWSEILNKPLTFEPSPHTHTFASLTGKPTTLAGYGITDAQPLNVDLTAIAAVAGTGYLQKTGAGSWVLAATPSGAEVAWNEIIGKPTTFPPEAHIHPDANTSASGFLSAADKIKLNGIASGATANDTDANLKNRANHTGTQPINTVFGLQAALDNKASANNATLAGITYSDSFSSSNFYLDGAPSAYRQVSWFTSGKQRWFLGITPDVTESGSNVGGDLSVFGYNDAGSYLNNPMTINRASGIVNFGVRPTFAGAVPWDSNNLQPPTNWFTVTDTYVASSGNRILADTTATPFTITLPEYGEVDIVDVAGAWANNNLTIDPASKIIRGCVGNLVCDQSASLKFVCLQGNNVWVVSKAEVNS